MNFSCGLCIVKDAKWTCSCGDAKLCESCVPTHLGKKTAEHLLSPLTAREPESTEAQDMIRAETERLDRIEQEICTELDKKEVELHAKVSALCGERKEQLKIVVRDAAAYLNGLGTGVEGEAAVLATRERGGHVFELNVKWGEIKDIGEIASFCFLPTLGESKVYRCEGSLMNKWTYNGKKIDAISLSTTRPILLTALDFPPTLPNNPPTVLKSFEVVEGPSTSGPVLYSHQEMELTAGEVARLTLSTAVSLKAGQVYTLKAVFAGGSTTAIKDICLEREETEGFSLQPAGFGPGDVSNLSTPTAGIFLAFHYLV